MSVRLENGMVGDKVLLTGSERWPTATSRLAAACSVCGSCTRMEVRSFPRRMSRYCLWSDRDFTMGFVKTEYGTGWGTEFQSGVAMARLRQIWRWWLNGEDERRRKGSRSMRKSVA